ncbi:papain-like cysteine protease family protein [Anaerocolumna xylanovorans]|uniref:papain-like cysteine protease family protein n=1 Tax=Anaerocolumna xylanovorans TaxID=100134 RepID=UPI00158817FA|nr:papain-like cysteine protease family protein [Anaerocolumna xylanovorans]
MIFTLVLTINLIIPVSASETLSDNAIPNEIITEINKSLNYISTQKDIFGLTDVDFGTLSVGNQIKAYEYRDKQLKEAEFSLFPIINNERLVAFAVKNNEKTSIEITTTFVKDIASSFNPSTPIAFIYDKDTCYIYSSSGLTEMHRSSQSNNGRDVLDYNTVDKSLFDSITLNNLSSNEFLNYESSVNLMAENTYSVNIAATTYYSCNVSYVSQAPDSYYCWASSVACIGNYLKGKSYTGEYVAQQVFGSNYNQQVPQEKALKALKDIYDVSYTSNNYVPSDNTILGSIKSGRPLFSGWWATWYGGHATVICGINIIAGYITIMNPQSGFQSATSNGTTYTYTSITNNLVYELERYGN